MSAPVENRALRAIFAIFPRFARFWADFWRYKPPLLTPTFAYLEVIYHHLLTPTFSILEVGKGQFLPPLKPPLLAILGHGPANLRPTQTNPQKARGVRKFPIHFHVKMGKISLCNSFSNKLLGEHRCPSMAATPMVTRPCHRTLPDPLCLHFPSLHW